jgi:hypothetical protein
MSVAADQRLTQFLKKGKDWERKSTSIPGIFLLRLSGLRSTVPPSLAIEVNLLIHLALLLRKEEL